jgi:hypothetical protein
LQHLLFAIPLTHKLGNLSTNRISRLLGQ